jgi:transcriptional regulator GlxA family with amidase domain
MHKVGFVVFPGFQVGSFEVVTVFEVANLVIGKRSYSVRVIAEGGGLVPCSAGFKVDAEPFSRSRFDTVIIAPGLEIEWPSAGLVQFVRQSLKTARRLAAPCTGAFILAEAGVLDGRRATTHWAFAHELKSRFPEVSVEEDRIFMVDGSVWTSAGMTAAIDLALAMVERDHGAEVARSVARKMVVYQRRAGGQSQFSALLDLEPKTDRIQKALTYARLNLQKDLSVEALADIAGLSPRQFSRAFREETSQSPAKAIEHLRVEAARLMLEEGRLPIEVIANEVGFGDRERMRRSFIRNIGHPPTSVRRNASQKRATGTGAHTTP